LLNISTPAGAAANGGKDVLVGIWLARALNPGFGDARYGKWCSVCWLGEYDECDVEPPRDCELMVVGLGKSAARSPERSMSSAGKPKPAGVKSWDVEAPRPDCAETCGGM
jgi:hypothetical protein